MNKYIVISEPGKVGIFDTDMPVRKKDEALLKLLYGGICGTDLGSYRGTSAYTTYPRIPGHEFSAEIIEIDENNKGLKKGMIVTANPYFNCGECYSCRRSLVNCCVSNQTMGVQREGAFTQYITMPIERIYDGKGIGARALSLIEPFCISYHAVKRAAPKHGEKLLVIGAGTIGIFAAMAAKRLGADVSICDVSPIKLDYAKNFGISKTFQNENPVKFARTIDELTDSDGFDVAIEAVGLPSTFLNCIDAAAFGGRVVLIGIGKENLDFSYSIIQKKELNIFGSRNALREDFIQLIEIVKNEEIELEKMITKEYPFKKSEQAFADLDKNAGVHLKVLFKF